MPPKEDGTPSFASMFIICLEADPPQRVGTLYNVLRGARS